MKKFFFRFILIISFLIIPFGNLANAQLKPAHDVNVHLFWSIGCPHCAAEKPFLEELARNNDKIHIIKYELTKNKDNIKLLQKVGDELDININAVPFTMVGSQHIMGFNTAETTGVSIEQIINSALYDSNYSDLIEKINNQKDEKQEKIKNAIPEKISIPIFGEINTKNLSLPLLTVVIGLIDGFNPCAMWILLFLISLLIGMENKKRRWLYGTVFIAASAISYFIFMAAWLNLLLFLGFITIIRSIIGLIAIGGGAFNIRAFIKTKEEGCEVVGEKKREKLFGKLKSIVNSKSFWLSMAGLITLAFSVNLVELICSAGLPAIYTQVLVMSEIPTWQYYAYLLLYIFFYMLDDLLVFIIAMITLELTGVTSKYLKWTHLIGGILMLIIGLLLIFRPEFLMFG